MKSINFAADLNKKQRNDDVSEPT